MRASHLLRRGVAVIAGTALLAAGLVATAVPAHAGPVTVTDPASGASVTLSTTEISAGERIEITGTGFTAKTGSHGDPLVAVRPYDQDFGPAWTVGGQDAYDPSGTNPTAASEAKYWFVTHHDQGGSFKGWIQAPNSLTSAGPLGNGDHWLRFLSGAFFTTTGDRLTDPITFQVPLTVAEQITTGLTSPTSVFQRGTTFRPSAQVTLRGRGFTPSTAVTVTLDNVALPSSITSEADGTLPSNARVTLPSNVAIGAHTLRITTGAVTRSVQISVTKTESATVLTERVRPGGTLAFDLAGYLGVGGKPQKIAVVINEQVLSCVEAGSDGSASGTVTLPSSLSGSVVVGFNVGLSCIMPPTGVINDQPISRIAPTITVSDSAPTLTAGSGSAGGKLALSGSGFAAGSTVAITAGSAKVGSLTANSTGTIDGSVPAPAKAGTYRVLADDGQLRAATTVTLASKPTAALTLSAPTPLTYGAARTTTVGLKIDGTARAGTVTLSQGSWSKTFSVPAGGLKVALPRDAGVGRHTVTAVVEASDSSTGAETSRTFTVVKAASSAGLKVSPSKVKKSKRATATIKVAVTGAPQVNATGKITIYDGSKKLTSATLNAGHRGTLKVTLPKISKKGTHKLKASYAGNANISAKTSGTVKLKVV